MKFLNFEVKIREYYGEEHYYEKTYLFIDNNCNRVHISITNYKDYHRVAIYSELDTPIELTDRLTNYFINNLDSENLTINFDEDSLFIRTGFYK